MRLLQLHTAIFGFVFWGVLCQTSIAQPTFIEISQEAGVDHFFEVFEGIFGGGAVVLDYNQDGWEDVFLASGAGKDQLLENQGDGTFVEVASQAGLDILNGLVTQGGASADVNKDGWPDLFITTVAVLQDGAFVEAPNVLLINDQDGTFSDQTETYGLTETTFSTGASFGDVNRDGYPDLYVCNYFEDYEGRLDAFDGPISNGFTGPGADLFYINNFGGGFTEASIAYGIERKGLTFQGLWSDFDNDNDLDILVANDFGNRTTPNLIYQNNYPENSFTEISVQKAFDYGINGMGFGATDINLDGYMDYIVTNIQISPFFINPGTNGPFIEQSVPRGTAFVAVNTAGGGRIFPVSWGINFFDMDHDLDQDLFIANGCLNPSLTPSPNLLLENDKGLYSDMSASTGMNDESIGRGSVVFDYDKDGDLDLLVVNQTPYRNEDIGVTFSGTKLYRNDQNGTDNWLQVKLKGNRSESQGIGSRVEVFVGGRTYIEEVYGGSSHESQNTTIMHFGLGQHLGADSVVVKWSASGRQTVENVVANQVLVIEETTEALDAGFLAYPNPFSDRVLVNFPESFVGKSVELALYNMIGQQVAKKELAQTQSLGTSIEILGELQAGVYVLVVSSGGERFAKKLVRE